MSDKRISYRVIAHQTEIEPLKERLKEDITLDSNVQNPTDADRLIRVEVSLKGFGKGVGKKRFVEQAIKVHDGEIVGDPLPISRNFLFDRMGDFFRKNIPKFFISYLAIVAGAVFTAISHDYSRLSDVNFLSTFPWMSVLLLNIVVAIVNVSGIERTKSD